MSDLKVVHTHELRIRFEQYEGGEVSWLIQADPAVENTSHATFDELVQAGAPLAALGVRALAELINPHIITAALDKGNMHLWQECYRQLRDQVSQGSPALEGELADDSDGHVVH